jgi:hypothetical protein
MVVGRRPVTEAVFAAPAEEQPGVAIRRAVRVCGLIPGPAAIPGVPHVAGVRTTAGQELRADLVADAMGRRSELAGLLAFLGGRPPQTDAADSGFAYYTRYFGRRRVGVHQPVSGPGPQHRPRAAQQLRQAVRDHLGEPAAFARAWDERTESAVATFHRHQVSADRIQWAEMTALRESRRYTSPASELSSLARAAG